MTQHPADPATAALVAELDRIRPRLVADGDLIAKRTADWVKPVVPANGERGGGSSAPSDEAIVDRMQDRQASRYHAEWRSLMKQATEILARMGTIAALACPPPQAVLTNRHLQAAQVATEGWCVSCWRNDRTCNPIALRPTGEPYYRDRCRPCGEWQAEYGQDPPLSILKLRHDGRRVTQADVDRALTGRKAG